MAKVNPCFEGIQVQACGFAENLHPPSSDSIFCKKTCIPKTLPFKATKTTTTEPMERRITLNDNSLKKKMEKTILKMKVTKNKTHSPPKSA